VISKIINDVVEHCYFFAKHSVDSSQLEIVGRHALSCPCTSDHERVKLVAAVNRNPDSGLVLV